jgi:aspartate/methionine/tyrosine aminotransferase
LFPDIVETGMDANDLAAEILEQARVAVVPGDERWFGPGAKGHLRISFATSEAILDEAITRIERWNRNR